MTSSLSEHGHKQTGGSIRQEGGTAVIGRTLQQRTWFGLTAVVLLVLLIGLGLLQDAPPAAQPVTAPAADFSAARAMLHLPSIAGEVHPVGTPQNAAVRNYLVAQLAEMGLQPQVQRAESWRSKPGRPALEAGTVYNVVARLAGTAQSGKAVVLMAHYDSVASAPGAGDTSIGVAAILETVRALQAGPSLQNDVIVLFTDSEEYALLGARAYLQEHAWAEDTGIVINLEGQGPAGPVYLFELSPQNGALVRALAQALPYPLMSSLSYAIYELLPNTNDFALFREQGYAGMTTVILAERAFYHSAFDRIERADPGAVQHQGSYALSLARHFGNATLPPPAAPDAVFFAPVRGWLVHYPASWAMPLALTAVAIFAVPAWYGFRRRRLQWTGVGLSFLALLLSLITAAAVTWLIVDMLNLSAANYRHGLFTVGFVALSVAVTLVLFMGLGRRRTLADRTTGILLGWGILALVSAFALPVASYLFLWPMLFFLPLLAYLVFGQANRQPVWLPAVVALSSLPVALLLFPLIDALFLAMTLGMPIPGVLLTVLTLVLLLPLIDFVPHPARRTLPVIALLMAALTIGVAVTAGNDADHPLRYDLSYSVNADSGDSGYITAIFSRHEWLDRFFAEGGRFVPMGDHKPFYTEDAQVIFADGPDLALPPPTATLVSDQTKGDTRILTLHIASPRQAPYLLIEVAPETPVLAASLNGVPIGEDSTQQDGWGLRYYGLPADGIDLTLTVPSAAPVFIRVVDQSLGLPAALGVPPPPGDLMPANYGIDFNSTYVGRTFSF